MSRKTELTQLHWQFKDRTEMRAQREINSRDELEKFIEETMKIHPLPEGAAWMICNEESKHFAMTHAETENAEN